MINTVGLFKLFSIKLVFMGNYIWDKKTKEKEVTEKYKNTK